MTREQLVEIILESYSANKEIKEYFEYFIAPDPDALYEKTCELIRKELLRNKYGNRSKARFSVVKKHIKKFGSFQPGTDYLEKIYIFTILCAMTVETFRYFAPAQFNGAVAIVKESLKWADKSGNFSDFFGKLTVKIEEIKTSDYFSGLVRSTVMDFINEKSK